MEKCPVCSTRLNNNTVCRRCKFDISTLIEIKEKSVFHYEKGVKACKEKAFDRMLYHAKRSSSLHKTPQNLKLFACAALITKEYKLAKNIWKQLELFESELERN